MQTLQLTSNNLALTRFDGLRQRPDPAPIASRAARSSFTQVMKETRRIDPPRTGARDQRAGPETTTKATGDHTKLKPADADTPEPTSDQLTSAIADVRSTRADSANPPAQNDGDSAQELPADSAVTGEVNTPRETIERPSITDVEADAAGAQRAETGAINTAPDAASSGTPSNLSVTTESTPATFTGLEPAPAADRAPIQASTPVPNATAAASPIGVVDDRTQLDTDGQAMARSSSSGADQSIVATEKQVLEPTTDSTESPVKATARGVTVLPSPSPDVSGNGPVLTPPPVSGERGAANHDARSLDTDRAPQDGGRLQSSASQPQSETSQDSRSNDRQSQPHSNQGERSLPNAEPSSHAPASARAVQIDAAVRVENATGQPVPVQSAVSLPAESLSPTNTTAGPAKELPTPSAPTRSADPNQNPFTARILRGLSATLNQRGGVLTMRLDPPQLGQLRIQMTITQGTVSAEFQASTPQAQALLERSLAVLRSALQGHGLTVERLTVQTTPQANAQVLRQDSPEDETPQGRQHADAGKGESRGRRDGDQSGSFHRTMSQPTTEYAAFDVAPQPAGAD